METFGVTWKSIRTAAQRGGIVLIFAALIAGLLPIAGQNAHAWNNPWSYYASWKCLGTTCYSSFEKQVADKVLSYTNKERTSRGIAALTWDNSFATMAYMHSTQMYGTGVFAHDKAAFKPGFQTALQRFQKVTTSANGSWGENIYSYYGSQTYTVDAAAKKIVSGWMASAGHKANILNKSFKYLGVGFLGNGTTGYCTQMFSSVPGTVNQIAGFQRDVTMASTTVGGNWKFLGFDAASFHGSKKFRYTTYDVQ